MRIENEMSWMRMFGKPGIWKWDRGSGEYGGGVGGGGGGIGRGSDCVEGGMDRMDGMKSTEEMVLCMETVLG